VLVLGMMTGTSVDGLDAVCAEFSGPPDQPDWRVRWHASLPYPSALRKQILALQLPKRKISLRELLAIDTGLGDWYGKAAASLIGRSEHAEAAPQIIANHGQTVAHHPDIGATLQLGDPSRISETTGLTVVSHFREGDLAARGQGAPLLPLFHQLLARKLSRGAAVAIHNLGGISNLSYIPADSAEVLAFDTGPSNVWIDEAVSLATRGKKKFDSCGLIARQGSPDPKAVKKLLSKPYFKKRPPKSTGRDDFPFSLLRQATRARGADLVATATEITVESIARAYEEFVLKSGPKVRAIYFAGGGAKNEFMMERLAARLAPIQTLRLADEVLEIPEQALEPLGFAFFGYRSLLGSSIGGSWTGARTFGPPGWITPGRNWESVLAHLNCG